MHPSGTPDGEKVSASEPVNEKMPPPVAREKNITAAQSSSGSERHHWAVCPRPTDDTSFPKRFFLKGDAVKWQYEIVHPATANVWEELKHDRAAGCEAGHMVRRAIRLVHRPDSCGNDWIVLERVDGGPIKRGVGAFRDSGRTGASAVSNIRPDELPGYQPEVRRRDQGWPLLVPIYQLDEQQGAPYSGQSFRQFLPPEIVSAEQATDLPADIDGVFEGRSQEISCDLGDDWQFDRIEAKANRFVGHAFRGRVIKSLAHQLAMIADDLEKALLEIPSNLSVDTIAAYFTSWRVWRHIVDWAPRVVWEMIQQKHPMIVQIDERAAVQFLHRQMWAYAQEVKSKSVYDASGSSEADSVATMKPRPSSDEDSIPAGSSSAEGPAQLEPAPSANADGVGRSAADVAPAPAAAPVPASAGKAAESSTSAKRRGRRLDQERRDAIRNAISQHSDDWRNHLNEIFTELDSKEVSLGDFQGRRIDLGDGKCQIASKWEDLDLAQGDDGRKIIDALRKYVD
jgi:hypothetical protein